MSQRKIDVFFFHVINPLLTKLIGSRWLDIDLVLFFGVLMELNSVSVQEQAKQMLANIQSSWPHTWLITHMNLWKSYTCQQTCDFYARSMRILENSPCQLWIPETTMDSQGHFGDFWRQVIWLPALFACNLEHRGRAAPSSTWTFLLFFHWCKFAYFWKCFCLGCNSSNVSAIGEKLVLDWLWIAVETSCVIVLHLFDVAFDHEFFLIFLL